MATKARKKARVDLDALAVTGWNHFRNYLDTCDKPSTFSRPRPVTEDSDQDIYGDSDGDVDELQELVSLLTPHVPKPIMASIITDANMPNVTSLTSLPLQQLHFHDKVSMLPVLLSVAHYHIADFNLTNYLHEQDPEEKEAYWVEARDMLMMSLRWFPSNSAAWSMAANLGRMSQRMSLKTVCQWYERGTVTAHHVRDVALEKMKQIELEWQRKYYEKKEAEKQKKQQEKQDATDEDKQEKTEEQPQNMMEDKQEKHKAEKDNKHANEDAEDQADKEEKKPGEDKADKEGKKDGEDMMEHKQENQKVDKVDKHEKKDDEDQVEKEEMKDGEYKAEKEEKTDGEDETDKQEQKKDEENKQETKDEQDKQGVQVGAAKKKDDSFSEWIELLLLEQVVGIEYLVPDEDEIDEDAEVTEDDDDFLSIYGASNVESTCRFMAAMLYSTTGHHDRALTHLKHFSLSHRLHPNIWHPRQHLEGGQPPAAAAATAATATTAGTGAEPIVYLDNVLPKALYDRLTKIFEPEGEYWRQSDYGRRDYYSYFMDLDVKASKSEHDKKNLIEQVIVDYLLPLVPKTQDSESNTICGAEWWAHSRPMGANLGHNLHFDTDEYLLANEQEIEHPLFSSVLYLTGGEEKNGEGAAGTTIVLDQRPASEQVAERGWQCVPRNNSFMIFPGDLLHGVLPCRTGYPDHTTTRALATAKETTEESIMWSSWQFSGNVPHPNTSRHRLTLMVGFWTRRVPDKMKKRRIYGPCGPLPPPTDKHSWVRELEVVAVPQEEHPRPSAAPLPCVSPVWEEFRPFPQADEAFPAMLHLPPAIDHRFFVKGAPQCFHDSLFEDDEDGYDSDSDDEDEVVEENGDGAKE